MEAVAVKNEGHSAAKCQTMCACAFHVFNSASIRMCRTLCRFSISPKHKVFIEVATLLPPPPEIINRVSSYVAVWKGSTWSACRLSSFHHQVGLLLLPYTLSFSHIMLWLSSPDLIGFQLLKLNSLSLLIHIFCCPSLFPAFVYYWSLGKCFCWFGWLSAEFCD